jgi:hypothetical protein
MVFTLGPDFPFASRSAHDKTRTGIGAEYLRGAAGERMVVLNARKLLADKKIIVHEEA